MKSGSREIQKRMLSQVPRLNMSMKEWVGKAAKYYDCTYLTLENIYYRPNRSIPNEIYIKLTSPSISGQPRPTNPNITELLNKFEEQQQSLNKLEKKLAREWEFKRKLATLLAESSSL